VCAERHDAGECTGGRSGISLLESGSHAFVAAKKGPNIIFAMLNRTNYTLLVSVMLASGTAAWLENSEDVVLSRQPASLFTFAWLLGM
jgi:hypothetical protein